MEDAEMHGEYREGTSETRRTEKGRFMAVTCLEWYVMTAMAIHLRCSAILDDDSRMGVSMQTAAHLHWVG